MPNNNGAERRSVATSLMMSFSSLFPIYKIHLFKPLNFLYKCTYAKTPKEKYA